MSVTLRSCGVVTKSATAMVETCVHHRWPWFGWMRGSDSAASIKLIGVADHAVIKQGPNGSHGGLLAAEVSHVL